MPQIDESKLNEYADKVFDRCNYFNEYVLETIARRIKATGQLSAYDQQTLKNMADISGDMKAITKKLTEITKMNIKDIEDIYMQTITDGVNSYKPLYDLKGMEFAAFEQNEFARQLVRSWAVQTAGDMVNLSRTKALCFDKYNLKGEIIGSTPLEGAFQKAIDDAVTAVSAGTVDFNTAMRETIINLGGSGVKVTYGNGVNRSLSGMVRQNLLYGAKQSAQAYDKHVGEQLDCDGFEVDYHPHPRPTHEFMGGVMYSYNGEVTIDGVIYEDGKKALARLEDYGCLHFKTDVILGVSVPRYDPEWLAEQKEKDKNLIEFDGKEKTKYGWQKVQRRIEAECRRQGDIANMAEDSGDKVLAKDCRDKIKAYRAKYDELCDTVGLKKRYNRMAAYKGRNLTDSGKSGIMELNRQSSNHSFKPMDVKRREKIFNGLRKNGADIITGKEAEDYLNYKTIIEGEYIEASSIGNIMFFRDNPTASAVFEETIHFNQYKQGRVTSSSINVLEIEAAQKMIKYQKAYGITDEEIKHTKNRLKILEGSE